MQLAIVSAEADGTTVFGEGIHELVTPAAQLSTALAGGGHEVTVYTPTSRRACTDEVIADQGYRVVQLPSGSAGLRTGLGEFTGHLERVWAQEQPDVVHAQSWLSGMAAQSAARSSAIPVVQTFERMAAVERRRSRSADTENADRAKLEALLARRANWVAANSTGEMVELFRMGCARSRISVVPCGVDSEVFHPPGLADARDATPFRIVSVASSTGRCNVEMVVHGVAALTDAELVFAFDAAAGATVTAEVERLRAAAHHAGVAHRLTTVAVSTATDLAELLSSADLCACVATTEPSGAVALMAMSCGVPVIATRVGALVDIVVDDVTGRLVSPGDVAGFVDAARKVLHEPFAGRGMGAAGRDRARARYSWDRVAADATRAYEGALGTVGSVSA
ncbi:glycosyltransferase family 1 protein [soil metagenome]